MKKKMETINKLDFDEIDNLSKEELMEWLEYYKSIEYLDKDKIYRMVRIVKISKILRFEKPEDIHA